MAETSYKKRDGLLTLSRDSKILTWTPITPPGAPPELTVSIPDITNLQQTPPDKPKVMMKVFAKSERAVDPLVHVFTFISTTQARAQVESLRDQLSTAIAAAKTASNGAVISGQQGSTSNSMAAKDAPVYSDDLLWNNFDLQQELLKQNTVLNRTFAEASKNKPDGITNSQFNKQFWSSRLGLLRAYAIERSQRTGEYNVLSVIKPRIEDEKLKLNVNTDQLMLLLRQYPVVRRAFDENVPKIEDKVFWTRFFQSRLLKKLKGERITEADPKDNILDKYLDQGEDVRLQRRLLEAHIPHTIDLHGNEENHSQRQGNAPDRSMRPAAVDKVPIIRTLNSMSERLMSQVAPNDIDPSEPIGVDEETFNQLALRDLQGDAEENRLILNVKDQGRFFANDKDSQADLNILTSTNTTPRELLQKLQKSLVKDHQGLSVHDLSLSLGVNNDSDSDSEDDIKAESTHFSSRASLQAASKQAFDLVAEQRTQSEDLSNAGFTSANAPLALVAPKSGLSVDVLDRLALTHATTVEFLHYFWSTFLSGDPTRAEEIASLTVTLDRARQRIKAVADEAELERAVEVKTLRQAAHDRARRLGRQPVPIDENAVKGGKNAVNRLMEPTVGAIKTALKRYEEAKLLSGLGNDA